MEETAQSLERPMRSRVQRNHTDGSNLDATVRQSRPYPNGQAGVEGLVEMLLHPVDRHARRRALRAMPGAG
jgi:hypothetical protein